MNQTAYTARPQSIFKTPDGRLGIVWNNGIRSLYKLRDLRLRCPCAHCVDEWTGQALLEQNSVTEDIALLRLVSVGRYAVKMEWSDGHNTGLYSYNLLAEIDGIQPISHISKTQS